MSDIVSRVPDGGDIFTEEALAGLIGRDVTVYDSTGDRRVAIGTAEVSAAEQRDGALILTFHTNEEVLAHLRKVGADDALVGFSAPGHSMFGPSHTLPKVEAHSLFMRRKP